MERVQALADISRSARRYTHLQCICL